MFRKFYIAPLICVFVLSTMSPQRANAGIPTIDVASIVQQVILVIEEIAQGVQLYEQIVNQVAQIENGIDQFENMNGDYFKDLLLNGLNDQEARRWLPESYQEVLQVYDQYSGTRYGSVRSAGWRAAQDLYVPDHYTIFKGDDDWNTPERERWVQHETDSMAVIGVAEGSFKRVSEIIDDTEALIADIPNSVDAKAAADLNNRIAAQNQLVLAEMLRLQSAQTATQGRDQLYIHALRGKDKQSSQVQDIRDFRDYIY